MLGGKIGMDVHHRRSIKGARHVIVGKTKGLSISIGNSLLEADRHKNILSILRHVPGINGILRGRWEAKHTSDGSDYRSNAPLKTALRKFADASLGTVQLTRNALGLNARFPRPTLLAALAQPHLLCSNGLERIDRICQRNAHVIVEWLSIETSDHGVAVVGKEGMERPSKGMADLLQAKYGWLLLGPAVLHLLLQF